MELEAVLKQKIERGQEVSAGDFMSAYPDLPRPTVYSRIRSMVLAGRLVPVGKGRYVHKSKMDYVVVVTPLMKAIYSCLIEECSGVDHCITDDGVNVTVQVPRADLQMVLVALSARFDKVITGNAYKQLPLVIKGYIIVSILVSDAPVCSQQGMAVPSLEKQIIDMICANKQKLDSLRPSIQRLFDVYTLNNNRLRRYAARRGVSSELNECISAVDMSRVRMFTEVQEYLAGTHITKAWVFGSFARCEEGASSDLDILVEYDHNSHLSLFGFTRYKLDIEAIAKRDVDLVVNGTLLPFAMESAEKDKYLLYER